MRKKNSWASGLQYMSVGMIKGACGCSEKMVKGRILSMCSVPSRGYLIWRKLFSLQLRERGGFGECVLRVTFVRGGYQSGALLQVVDDVSQSRQ